MSIRSQCSRHLVTHQPRSASVGSAGSQAFTYSGTTQKRCFIQPRTSYDSLVLDQREYVITHVVYFADDPGSSHGDHLVVVVPTEWAGRVLEQIGKPVDQAGVGRLWRVDCEERERNQ